MDDFSFPTCRRCITIENAVDPANITCTSDTDSQLGSACGQGHWKDTSGRNTEPKTADICRPHTVCGNVLTNEGKVCTGGTDDGCIARGTVRDTGTASVDVTCDPCTSGWAAVGDGGNCQPNITCPAGTWQSETPNETQDRECTALSLIHI